MHLTRRSFLTSLTMTAALPRFALAAGPQIITARPGEAQIVPAEFPMTRIWGYDGLNPGPVIRAPQGVPLQRRLINALPQPTTIHWHGIRLANAMDGVPGITQDAVPPGGQFDYDFVPPDAGTYWYHSHNQSTEQVARGLYGPLVIEEPDGPDVDHDIVVVFDDWLLTREAQLQEPFEALHAMAHAGRIGNFISAELRPKLDGLEQNQRLRLRLLNVCTDRVVEAGVQGLAGAVVALDGMPLAVPQPVDRIVLAPAQRADLIVDVTAEPGGLATIVLFEQSTGYALSDIPVTGRTATVARGEIAALPPNPVASPDDAGTARRMDLTMAGGAMGGLRDGIYQGRRLDMRELAAQGQVWTLNGVAGLPDTPFATLDRGETLRLRLGNETGFAHGIHLHGHHFREIRADGGLGPFRDTILVAPQQTRDIAFVGDNPGDWLLHCHMLSHQSSGMKTWLRVRA